MKIDIPSIHFLVELLLRSLPAFKSIWFLRGSRFESHHQLNKQLIQRASHNVGSIPEVYCMKQAALVESLRFMLTGGRWGSKLEHKADDRILSLRNELGDLNGFAEHQVLHYFPCLFFCCCFVVFVVAFFFQQRCNRVLNRTQNKKTKKTDFEPYKAAVFSYVWIREKGKRPCINQETPTSTEIEAIQACFECRHPESKIDLNSPQVRSNELVGCLASYDFKSQFCFVVCFFQAFKWVCAIKRYQNGKPESFKIGEDCSVSRNNNLCYLRIERMVEVDGHVFVFPIWYGTRPKSKFHPERNQKIVVQWQANENKEVRTLLIEFSWFDVSFSLWLNLRSHMCFQDDSVDFWRPRCKSFHRP